jgi:hypothetical protein
VGQTDLEHGIAGEIADGEQAETGTALGVVDGLGCRHLHGLLLLHDPSLIVTKEHGGHDGHRANDHGQFGRGDKHGVRLVARLLAP